MRITFLIITILLLGSKISSQHILNEKLTPQTRLSENSNTIKSRELQKVDKKVIVVHEAPLDAKELSQIGAKISRTYNGFSTVVIPAEKVSALSEIPTIKHVHTGYRADKRMDKIITSVRADSVHAGIDLPIGYTGENVIIAIIDNGFQFQHPFYRSETGEYRIKRLWLQNDQSGAHPDNFAYGTELIDSTSIMAVDYDLIPEGGHGQTMAMVAGGSGYGMEDFRQKGIATNAEFVLVSTMLNTEAEAIDAIQYCADYAASVGKPLVINCSFGFMYTPGDGTAILDQYVDSLILNHTPPIINFGAVGNDGLKRQNLLYQFTATDTIYSALGPVEDFTLEMYNGAPLPAMVWGQTNNQFETGVGLMNANGEVMALSTLRSSQNNVLFADTVEWMGNSIVLSTVTTPSYFTNNKPHNALEITMNIVNDETFPVIALKSTNGSVQCQFPGVNLNNFNPHNGSVVQNLISGDDAYCIGGTPASSIHTIGVGGYVNKIYALNIEGDSVEVNHLYDEGTTWTEGDHIFYSVKGPTLDNRVKPDIVTPTDGIYATAEAVTFNEPHMLADSLYWDGRSYYFSVAWGGTSSATPVAAGVAALVFQANPSLSALEVRNIILQSAIVDTFVTRYGNVPNNTMGYGKINAYKAVKLALESVSVEEIEVAKGENYNISVFPNPSQQFVNYLIEGENQFDRICIYDQNGREVLSQQIQNTFGNINISNLASGLYVVGFIGAENKNTLKLIID